MSVAAPSNLDASLAAWLAEQRPDVDEVVVRNCERAAVGYSGETLMLTVDWRTGQAVRSEDLVIRVQPTSTPLLPDSDPWSHFQTLRALQATPVLSPAVRWFQQAEGSPFGEPFFVMERVTGCVPQENPPFSVAGWFARSSVEARSEMNRSALRAMAAIHQVSVDALTSGADDPPLLLSMDARVAQLREYATWVYGERIEPVIDESLDWLGANRPPATATSLIWGDAKLTNIVFSDTSAVGLLDWELAAAGSPEEDLVFWTTYHRSITLDRGFPWADGLLDDEETYAYYERESGHRLENIDFYRTWHLLRLAVMSRRLTDLLIDQGRVRQDATTTPHSVPLRLLLADRAS